MSSSGLERFVVATTAALALAVCVARARHDGADHPTDYVVYEAGALPIVLVVPHDGDLWRPGVPSRKVTPRRDEGTHAFAIAVADRLEARLGARPHVIRVRMDRRQLDVNRPAAAAYEHLGAGEVYDAFHARVAKTTRACGAGRCLLLDLHGNWEFPADLYLGSGNGRTIATGSVSTGSVSTGSVSTGSVSTGGISIETRLRDAARAAGFQVADRDATPKILRDDFITTQFGRPKATGTEAVMVELHQRIREDAEARAKLAEAVAEAVAAHVRTGAAP